MQLTRIAVLGAGSIEHAPSAIAALANYFGERPFEIALWDADKERLDLMCRFARLCCTTMRSQHVVSTADNLKDVLEGVDLVLILGRLPMSDEALLSGLRVLRVGSSEQGEQLEDWVSTPVAPETYQAFHQVLRWIRSDEHPFEWLARHQDTPLKAWLDRFTEERIESER